MAVIISGDKLTKNFSLGEYAIDQTGKCYINHKAFLHAQMLQELRDFIKKPIYVTSWYRTKKYNRAIGGVSDSNHLTGCATDIYFGSLNEEAFIVVAREWRKICMSHGVVGEAGYYPDDGFLHLGSSIRYSDTFYNWRTKNGVQKNGYYNKFLR